MLYSISSIFARCYTKTFNLVSPDTNYGDCFEKIIFVKIKNFVRLQNRLTTRFIAYIALITSVITFLSGFCVFLYMKSPKFENQLLGQVIKHLRPVINHEIKTKLEERN